MGPRQSSQIGAEELPHGVQHQVRACAIQLPKGTVRVYPVILTLDGNHELHVESLVSNTKTLETSCFSAPIHFEFSTQTLAEHADIGINGSPPSICRFLAHELAAILDVDAKHLYEELNSIVLRSFLPMEVLVKQIQALETRLAHLNNVSGIDQLAQDTIELEKTGVERWILQLKAQLAKAEAASASASASASEEKATASAEEAAALGSVPGSVFAPVKAKFGAISLWQNDPLETGASFPLIVPLEDADAKALAERAKEQEIKAYNDASKRGNFVIGIREIDGIAGAGDDSAQGAYALYLMLTPTRLALMRSFIFDLVQAMSNPKAFAAAGITNRAHKELERNAREKGGSFIRFNPLVVVDESFENNLELASLPIQTAIDCKSKQLGNTKSVVNLQEQLLQGAAWVYLQHVKDLALKIVQDQGWNSLLFIAPEEVDLLQVDKTDLTKQLLLARQQARLATTKGWSRAAKIGGAVALGSLAAGGAALGLALNRSKPQTKEEIVENLLQGGSDLDAINSRLAELQRSIDDSEIEQKDKNALMKALKPFVTKLEGLEQQ